MQKKENEIPTYTNSIVGIKKIELKEVVVKSSLEREKTDCYCCWLKSLFDCECETPPTPPPRMQCILWDNANHNQTNFDVITSSGITSQARMKTGNGIELRLF